MDVRSNGGRPGMFHQFLAVPDHLHKHHHMEGTPSSCISTSTTSPPLRHTLQMAVTSSTHRRPQCTLVTTPASDYFLK
uniref:Uncharacterized protein n=1 Tax=Ascaris lumbricoides TaxID=6252 RepID=A0A0M3HW35_ASCLU